METRTGVIQGDMSTIKDKLLSEIRSMRSDVSKINSDMKTMGNTISKIRKDVREIHGTVDTLLAFAILGFFSGVAGLITFFSRPSHKREH